MVRIGIIGGSGLDNPELLQDFKEIEVDTNLGRNSKGFREELRECENVADKHN